MSAFDFGLVIPCYNFGEGLARSLHSIAAWRRQHSLQFMLCIIDDGSSDSTEKVAKEFQAQHKDWCLFQRSPQNRGKGSAVREGFKLLPVSIPYVFFTDSDLHYGLEILRERMLPLLKSGAELVMLDRSWNRQFHSRVPLRRALSYGFTHLKTILASVPFEDSQAGLKGFRREFLQAAVPMARVNGFAFDVELLSMAVQYRFRVERIPILLRGEKEADSSSVTPRKAIRMLWDLLRIAYARYSGGYENDLFYQRISQQVYEIHRHG